MEGSAAGRQTRQRAGMGAGGRGGAGGAAGAPGSTRQQLSPIRRSLKRPRPDGRGGPRQMGRKGDGGTGSAVVGAAATVEVAGLAERPTLFAEHLRAALKSTATAFPPELDSSDSDRAGSEEGDDYEGNPLSRFHGHAPPDGVPALAPLPDEAVRAQQGMELPEIPLLSPRDQQRLAVLPPPSDWDNRRVEQLLELPTSLENKRSLFRALREHKTGKLVKKNPDVDLGGGGGGGGGSRPGAVEDVDSIATKSTKHSRLSRTSSGRKGGSTGSKADGTRAASKAAGNDALQAATQKEEPGGEEGGGGEDEAEAEGKEEPVPVKPVVDAQGQLDMTAFQNMTPRAAAAALQQCRESSAEEHAEFLDDWKTQVLDQLGVMVDPLHSSSLRRTRALNRAREALSRNRAQEGFAIWLRNTRELTEWLRQRGATKFQSIVRMYFVRVDYLTRIALVREQKAALARRDRLRKQLEISAVAVMQLWWWRRRGNDRISEKRRRRLAATTIQCAFRCMRARVYLEYLREVYEYESWFAAEIQRVARGYLGRQFAERTRLIAGADRILNAKRERHEQAHMMLKEEGAAARIQRAFRKKYILNRLHLFLVTRRNMAATLMQAVGRGLVARRAAAAMFRRRDYIRRAKARGASLFQALWRGYCVRKRFAYLVVEREARKAEQMALKEIALSDFMLGFETVAVGQYTAALNVSSKTRALRRALRSAMPLRGRFEDRHARIIQRNWRRHFAQRRCAHHRILWAMNRVSEELEFRRRTATTIQRVYRGHIGRRKYRKIIASRAITMMQSVVRMRLGVIRAFRRRNRKDGAVVIQRYYRGFAVRQVYTPLLQIRREQAKHIAVLLRLCRSYINRKKVRRGLEKARAESERSYSLRQHADGCLQRLRLVMMQEELQNKDAGADDGREGTLVDMFHLWLGKGGGVDSTAFSRMVSTAPALLTRSFTKNEVDIVFSKATGPGYTYLRFAEFGDALYALGNARFPTLASYSFAAKGEDARLLVVLLDFLLSPTRSTSPEMRAIRRASDERLQQRAGMYCARIQALVRGVQCRAWSLDHMTSGRARRRRVGEELQAAVTLARAAQVFLARAETLKRARKQVRKYVEFGTQKEYWTNFVTGEVSWTAPKVLRDNSCRVIKLPNPKFEYVVTCANCVTQTATQLCEQCEEAYCDECFENMHLKGNRSSHQAQKIRMCVHCEYQMAALACQTCTASNTDLSRQLLCDWCFKDQHRTAETSEHTTLRIVQACEECGNYSARWRCFDCFQVYCQPCFERLHQRGGMARHKYEKLSYYTPYMHGSYKKDIARVMFMRKLDTALKHIREIFTERNRRCATKIQAWYRGILGWRIGTAYLREQRRLRHVQWKQRQVDNVVRAKAWYRAADVVGLAPRLRSDTREERVLKRIAVWKRWKRRELIWKNVCERGLFRDLQKDPKKVPRRGFRVGTLSELVDQARRGGVRLPGHVTLQHGGSIAVPRAKKGIDLISMVEPGDMLRVRDQIFIVRDVVTIEDEMEEREAKRQQIEEEEQETLSDLEDDDENVDEDEDEEADTSGVDDLDRSENQQGDRGAGAPKKPKRSKAQLRQLQKAARKKRKLDELAALGPCRGQVMLDMLYRGPTTSRAAVFRIERTKASERNAHLYRKFLFNPATQTVIRLSVGAAEICAKLCAKAATQLRQRHMRGAARIYSNREKRFHAWAERQGYRMQAKQPTGGISSKKRESEETLAAQQAAAMGDEEAARRARELATMSEEEQLEYKSQGHDEWDEDFDDERGVPFWVNKNSNLKVYQKPDSIAAREKYDLLQEQKAIERREARAKMKSAQRQSSKSTVRL